MKQASPRYTYLYRVYMLNMMVEIYLMSKPWS